MSFDYAGTFCRYRTVNLAVVPTRRDTFPAPADAVEHKKQVMPVLLEKLSRIHDVNVITAEHLLPDGLLCDQTQVESVYRYLREKEADALFVPHMNFGYEEAVAQLAYRLGVPVLLWGPRDGERDSDENVRTYDTQCGMFATSRALLRYGVKFTYIENCWLDDPKLDEGLDMFIRA
ncbi:MAG: sugar isomerase, partial [Oscillospiraceae bacterium]|nr:sugar isomerase [Oscillospiraceae bacterium]